VERLPLLSWWAANENSKVPSGRLRGWHRGTKLPCRARYPFTFFCRIFLPRPNPQENREETNAGTIVTEELVRRMSLGLVGALVIVGALVGAGVLVVLVFWIPTFWLGVWLGWWPKSWFTALGGACFSEEKKK